MFGNVYPPADVACPLCGKQPNLVTYVYFDTVAMFCERCEHAWQIERAAHPELDDVLGELSKDADS